MNTQAILGFLKKNLISVIAIVLALIGVPVMVYFSMQMTTSLQEEVQQEVSGKAGEIRSNSTINYSIPPTEPNAQGWQASGTPHPEVIAQVIEVMKVHNASSEEVRELVLERNRKEGGLVLGEDTSRLLPAPASEGDRVELLTRLIREYRSVHQKLLDDNGFRMPPTREAVYEQLVVRYDREVEQAANANENREPTASQMRQITEAMTADRIAAYELRAEQTTVYGSIEMFEDIQAWPAGELPTLSQAWYWQLYTWVHQDIIEGLRRSNDRRVEGEQGRSVVSGPLKRVQFVDVRRADEGSTAPDAGSSGRGGGRGGRGGRGSDPFGGGGGGPSGPVSASLAQGLPRNYTVAHTGRLGWPAATNGYYDTLYVDLVLIADPNRLDVIIDAIQSVNLQTVIDVEYTQISPYRDLSEGFYYGTDAVAEVRMTVETVWLREWLGELMPDAVRREWQMPDRGTSSEGA